MTWYRLCGLKIKITSFIGFGKHLRDCRFIRIGKNTRIRRHITINCYGKYRGEKLSPQLLIGNNVYINDGFMCLVTDKVTIENNVTVGPNVSVMSHNHGLNPESQSYLDNKLEIAPVTLKDGCWIGDKSIILPGVTVGKKAVIGAGSVVTKSIDDYAMAVGNPARIIKRYNLETKKWEKVNG